MGQCTSRDNVLNYLNANLLTQLLPHAAFNYYSQNECVLFNCSHPPFLLVRVVAAGLAFCSQFTHSCILFLFCLQSM